MQLGIDRVLTSGAAANALDGAPLIQQMVELSQQYKNSKGKHNKVIAGGGVTPANIRSIIEITKVKEVHGTARVTLPSRNEYRPPNEKIVYMGGERKNTPEAEYTYKQSTTESVSKFIQHLH